MALGCDVLWGRLWAEAPPSTVWTTVEGPSGALSPRVWPWEIAHAPRGAPPPPSATDFDRHNDHGRRRKRGAALTKPTWASVGQAVIRGTQRDDNVQHGQNSRT